VSQEGHVIGVLGVSGIRGDAALGPIERSINVECKLARRQLYKEERVSSSGRGR
jgi:hypothetical protein